MDKPLIECKLDIMMGRPVIAGTRITVELVLEKLAHGEDDRADYGGTSSTDKVSHLGSD